MNIDRVRDHIKNNSNKIILTLGEFELRKQLGQGGNGIVYEAQIQTKIVAIKFLITDATGNTKEQKQKRFLAEYFNIVTIDDLTGIVKYIDYDTIQIHDKDGELVVPVIIMKKYASSLEPLQKVATKELFVALFNFLIDTIKKIHLSGIVHRDLKPENILVDENLNFVLADFGIASYNPEMFKIKAETAKKERIGNRLFSAPEQEEAGVIPHPSMDIYAIGQILQWFATGKTHRGTGRQNISQVFDKFIIEDNIIEKCLDNNPMNRFQSIQEIYDYKTASRKKPKEDVWQYVSLFNKICRQNFPKNETGFVYSNNPKKIDRLFNSIMDVQDKFKTHLWWQDGMANTYFQLKHKGECTWKLSGTEFVIKELWMHYDSNEFNDYILIHYIPSTPFIIDGKETNYAALIDDNIYITSIEYENGFAEINDEIIDLSKHSVESIHRNSKEGYLFIASRYNCILRPQNDLLVRDFIEKFKINKIPSDEDFESFTRAIRVVKHPEIAMDM